jgi:hypothetical protein
MLATRNLGPLDANEIVVSRIAQWGAPMLPHPLIAVVDVVGRVEHHHDLLEGAAVSACAIDISGR